MLILFSLAYTGKGKENPLCSDPLQTAPLTRHDQETKQMCILLIKGKEQEYRIRFEITHRCKCYHLNVPFVCTIFWEESNIFRLDASFQRELPEFLQQVGAEVRAATCQKHHDLNELQWTLWKQLKTYSYRSD